MSVDDLSPGEILIRAAYSSVNYKDALAGTGKGKILRRFPLNGGIDVAGHVVASSDAGFREGDAVLCTGSGLSETRDGGYSEFAQLEARSAIHLPDGLSLRESMILGTAGFTAALALYRMLQNEQRPDMGPIVVTGATGGVGMLAIDILTRAGFEVQAITGKTDHPHSSGTWAHAGVFAQGPALGRTTDGNAHSGPAPSTTWAARCSPACRGSSVPTATSPAAAWPAATS